MRRVRSVVLSIVLSAAAVLVATPVDAAPPPAPGTVLTRTAVTLPPELAERATGVRIEYVTTDIRGTRITATGLLLTPRTGVQGSTVVWAHGTTGLADRCAPSRDAEYFWPEARLAVRELLSRGWTVAAPDYPGLGTTQEHPYLVGDSEGRSIIDIVRAAKNVDARLGHQYAIDGHSQGGQGGLFAGEIAPSYDGPFQLRGVSAIAPASHVEVLADAIPGTPGNGYLVMGVMGLAAVDGTVNPGDIFARPALDRSAVLRTGCLWEIIAAYADLSATELLQNGGALPPAVVAKLVRNDNPGQRRATAPILVVQGLLDETVPVELTDDLVDTLDNSQPVRYLKLPNAGHDEAVIQSTTLVADWIASRFS